MKQILFLIIISLLPSLSFGQDSYYIADSIKSIGIKLIDGGKITNSEYCQIAKGNKTIKYTPSEISEYGFKDGRIFVSKEIRNNNSIKKVFLEIIYAGETTLYSYSEKNLEKYYFQKDSSLLVEIQKQNPKVFRNQLKRMTNNSIKNEDVYRRVKYNRKSLSKFLSWQQDYNDKPFPSFKIGIVSGIEFLKLKTPNANNNDLKYLDFNIQNRNTFGFFIDNPIGFKGLSFHSEILFSKHQYTIHEPVNNLDFNTELNGLSIPLLLKYAVPNKNSRPFVNLGLIGKYYINNQIHFTQTVYKYPGKNTFDLTKKTSEHRTVFYGSNNMIDYKTDERSIISKENLGYCLGGGFELELNYKNSLYLEFRYSNFFGIIDSEIPGSEAFNVLVSINL